MSTIDDMKKTQDEFIALVEERGFEQTLLDLIAGKAMSVAYEDVEVIKETELALLCDVDGQEVWIPKSVMGEDSEISEEGDVGLLVVASWFAKAEL